MQYVFFLELDRIQCRRNEAFLIFVEAVFVPVIHCSKNGYSLCLSGLYQRFFSGT